MNCYIIDNKRILLKHLNTLCISFILLYCFKLVYIFIYKHCFLLMSIVSGYIHFVYQLLIKKIIDYMQTIHVNMQIVMAAILSMNFIR